MSTQYVRTRLPWQQHKWRVAALAACHVFVRSPSPQSRGTSSGVKNFEQGELEAGLKKEKLEEVSPAEMGSNVHFFLVLS